MSIPRTTIAMANLEEIIDTHGLMWAMCALAEICNEKAEHLRGNWQDAISARYWDRAAATVRRASEAKPVTILGG